MNAFTNPGEHVWRCANRAFETIATKALLFFFVVAALVPSETAALAQDGASVHANASAHSSSERGTQEYSALGRLDRSSAEFSETIALNLSGVKIEEAIEQIAEQSEVKFVYGRKTISADERVTLRAEQLSMAEAVQEVLHGTGLEAVLSGSGQVIVVNRDDEFGAELATAFQLTAFQKLAPLEVAQPMATVPSSFLQQGTIAGTVTDAETGEALPGVNVVVVGTQQGAATDAQGRYQIPALEPGTYSVRATFVGYQESVREGVEVQADETSVVDFGLVSSAELLEGVVVTGYGEQRRQDITGSVSVVDAEALNQQSTAASALSKLKGQVSGVNIETNGSPGARNTVRIRGISSFGNNDPLYIVDGVQVQGSFLNYVNPSDIESVQVLKDAASASIYGARASSGVVIIETKKGRSGQDLQVSFSSRVGVATTVGGFDDVLIQNSLDFAEFERRAGDFPENIYGDPSNPSVPAFIWPNNNVDQTSPEDLRDEFGLTPGDASFPFNATSQADLTNLIFRGSEGTDWWGALFADPALVHEYNLNLSGGGETTAYSVSFNFLDQEGTMNHNFYKRGSIRVNSQTEVGRFTFGENISFAVDQTAGGMRQGTMGEGTPVGQLIKMQPVVPVRDASGEGWGGAKANGLGNGENPVAQVYNNRNDVIETTNFIGNVFGMVDITENLQYESSLGARTNNVRSESFGFPTPAASEPTLVNSFSDNFSRSLDWNFSNTLTYDATLMENHNLRVMGGGEAVRENFRGFNGSQNAFLSTDTDVRYINDAVADPATKNISTSGNTSTLLSFFGKLDYNYRNRYLISVTARRDGSSRLGDQKWGTFPAASAGWRISEESFMDDVELFDDLKVRFSFGITGNQEIPPGRTVDQFGGGVGQVFADVDGDGTPEGGFRITSAGNPNLRWEENASYNTGIDAVLLGGQMDFTLDLWLRNTKDLLFNPRVPGTRGNVSPPFRNVGRMQNKGVDFSFGYNGSIGSEISWNVNLNGSHYTNIIKRVTGGTDSFFGPVGGRQGTLNINKVGEPIGAFYGLKTDGIFQTWEEVDAHVDQGGAAPGRLRFVDVNGDGTINLQDRTVIGDYHPDFTGGLNLGFQWRNLDFSTFLFTSIGNEIFDLTREFTVFNLFDTNVRRDVLEKSAVVVDENGNELVGGEIADRSNNGRVQNPNAEFPAIDDNDQFSNAYSDFYVEDASYLRVQNMEIGYSLSPNSNILGWAGFQRARIYFQAQNLFTITGYDNPDPALPANQASNAGVNVSDQGRGIDRGTYPNNRMFNMGINITF